jgi:hypothetical protein
MKKKIQKLPKKITRNFIIDQYQGFAAIAISMQAPEGYRFLSMDRKGNKATITYVLKVLT